MALTVEVSTERDGRLLARLSGVIDERANVADQLSKIQGDATIDLSGVERVNSVGLLQWVKAIQPLTERHRIEVEKISYALALQASQLVDLFGGARVRSCLAPYFCPKCRANRQVPVSAEDVQASADRPPAKSCPECGQEMDFDDVEEFFYFLRNTPRR